MDYFEGDDLETRLKKGDMDFDKEKTATQMLRKLFAIYTLGIIHRDISPKNILINDSGNPQIIDFSTQNILIMYIVCVNIIST